MRTILGLLLMAELGLGGGLCAWAADYTSADLPRLQQLTVDLKNAWDAETLVEAFQALRRTGWNIHTLPSSFTDVYLRRLPDVAGALAKLQVRPLNLGLGWPPSDPPPSGQLALGYPRAENAAMDRILRSGMLTPAEELSILVNRLGFSQVPPIPLERLPPPAFSHDEPGAIRHARLHERYQSLIAREVRVPSDVLRIQDDMRKLSPQFGLGAPEIAEILERRPEWRLSANQVVDLFNRADPSIRATESSVFEMLEMLARQNRRPASGCAAGFQDVAKSSSPTIQAPIAVFDYCARCSSQKYGKKLGAFLTAFKGRLQERGLSNRIQIVSGGCRSQCNSPLNISANVPPGEPNPNMLRMDRTGLQIGHSGPEQLRKQVDELLDEALRTFGAGTQ